MNTKAVYLKTLTLLSFLVMVFVNYLAVTLPLNGVDTKQVSDSFPNLFAPAPYTFSIWGVIYLLLGGYSIYQFGSFRKNKKLSEIINKINPIYILTCVANSLWIFAWHSYALGATVILMLVLLGGLIKISGIINKQKFSQMENILVRVPFGVYFGWITVATIANITTFLVSIKWNGFGLNDQFWMTIVLVVGMLIAALRSRIDRNIPYLMVVIWAYVGIFVKHYSAQGFAGKYPGIMAMTLACVIFLLISVLHLVRTNKSK